MSKEKSGTKLCKHCKTEIPYNAKICPNCRKKQSGVLKWIIIALAIFIIIPAIIGNNSKEQDSNPKKVGSVSQNESANSENIDNTFSVGDIVETKDFKISFLSAREYTSDNEYIQPKDGNMYYKMDFEFENISDSDKTVSTMMDWTCYADSYKVDQTWLGDDNGLDAKLSSGNKAKGSIYFELPANSEKITLEYAINYFKEDKIIFNIK